MSGRMGQWRRVRVVAAAYLLVGTTVATVSAQGASPSVAPPPGDELRIVVIGDSIPYNADSDCPGCTSFAQGYGEAVEAQVGRPVVVRNMSRHDGATTNDIAEQLDGAMLDSLLGDADVIIISIGFNDQPPYWGPDRPCVAAALDTDEQAIAAMVETTTACVDEATAQTRATASTVLGRVRELAPGAAVGVITAYNAWTGWSELDAAGPETAAEVTDRVVYALEQWRSALCAEAAVVEAVCVDLLEPFNGPDGRTPAGDLLADDYTHPSKLGNDLIRDLLLASGLYPASVASPAA